MKPHFIMAPLPDSAAPPPTDPLIDRRDVAFLFRRHGWIFVTIPFLLLLLGVGVARFLTPVYESRATLLVNPEFHRAVRLAEAPANAQDLPPVTALKSMEVALIADSVILRVVERLNLRSDPGFLPPNLAAKPKLLDSELLAYVKGHRIRASLIEETRLIEIVVRDCQPERCRAIANQIAAEWESFLEDQKLKELQQSRELLEEKAKAARQSALAADEKLRQFRLEHPRMVVEQDHDLFAQRLASMGAELNQVRRELAQFESRESTLRDMDPAQSPLDFIAVADYKIFHHLAVLQNAHAASMASLEAASKIHSPAHPAYKAALAQEQNNRAEIVNLAKDIRSAVSSRLSFLREREKIIANDLDKAHQEFDEVKTLSSEFRGIQQQSEREWATHQALQAKLNEADLTGVTGYQAATLISPALLPYEPVFPRVSRFGLVGGCAGIFISAALLGFFIIRGVPLTHVSQVEALLPGCPVLTASIAGPLPGAELPGSFSQVFAPHRVVIMILTLDERSRLSEACQEISRAAAQWGSPCLWLKISPPPAGDARIQPSGTPNLFTLALPAWQAKDFVRFPRLLHELRHRFKHIIVEASECADKDLEDYLARLADHSLAVVPYGRTRKTTLARRIGSLPQSAVGPSAISCLFATPQK